MSAVKQVVRSGVFGQWALAVGKIPSSRYSQTAFPYGKITDKKSVKLVLEKDKKYSWCTCGYSKKQPFCDDSHKQLNTSNPDPSTHFRSHKFTVSETKEYFLCNCKQTRNRPFCDGTHKQKFVQEAVLD